MQQLNHADLSQLTQQVEDISRKVGHFLREERRNFKREHTEHKGRNNLVSYVDQEAEKKFVSALNELLPDAGFIAEEGTGTASKDGYNWIIDPLDGTTNYIHNIPFYCTSVALAKGPQVLLGVVYDPSHDEMFSACEGKDTTLNGETVQVSSSKELTNMLMVTGFPYDQSGLLNANLNVIRDLTNRSRGIRRLGSAALDLCYVACGRVDGMYEYGLSAWDVAAGVCLVAQAGGKCNDFEERNDPLFNEQLLCGSQRAYKELLPIVRAHFVS